jgi:carbamoyl-phosphate synthase large subunit
MGEDVPRIDRSAFDLDYVGVKAPQFSFTRLKGSDPVLSVEMTSTGEVACLGDDFNEAFLKSLISVGFRLPRKNIFISAGQLDTRVGFLPSMKILQDLNFHFFATPATADFMKKNRIPVKVLHWPQDNKEPNARSYLSEGQIDLVINLPENMEREELDNDYLIRRKAVDMNIPLITNLQLAKRFVEALSRTNPDELKIKSWDEYHL